MPRAPRLNSASLCNERRSRGTLQVGERSRAEARVAGGQARGRRARPARPARRPARAGAPAPGAARAERAAAASEPGSLFGRSGAGQQKWEETEARGAGRQARATLVVDVCVFCFRTPPGRSRGCFVIPRLPAQPGPAGGRPGGGGRRRGPASGAFPATCQFYCCRASESLRISPSSAAPRSLDPPDRPPHCAPRAPRPRARPRRRGAWGRRAGVGGRDRARKLAGERRVAGEPPWRSRAARRNAWICSPGAGAEPSRTPCSRRGGNELG